MINKELTDLLGPLIGYLRKQVGRHWDKVYSEIAANLPQSSMAKSHVRDHIFDFVTVASKVEMVDKKPYHKGGSRRWSSVPFPIESSPHYLQLYVDPRTGVLREAPMRKTKPYKRAKKQIIYLAENIIAMKMDDVWYGITVRDFDEAIAGVPVMRSPDRLIGNRRLSGHPIPPRTFDFVHRSFFNRGDAIQTYGAPFIGVHKHALNSREIKKFNLNNG